MQDAHYWREWFRRAEELSQRILQERGGQPLDVDLVIMAAKEELATRHDELFQNKKPRWKFQTSSAAYDH